MKKFIFIGLILGLIIVAWGQSEELISNLSTMEDSEKCSQINSGLQLCTKQSSFNSKLNEDVTIEIIIRNVSDNPKVIETGPLYKLYDVIITNPKGETLLTRFEQNNQKLKKGNISEEKVVVSLPINTMLSSLEIEPNKEKRFVYNLSQLYEFKDKGTYHLKLSKKIFNDKSQPSKLQIESIPIIIR